MSNDYSKRIVVRVTPELYEFIMKNGGAPYGRKIWEVVKENKK